MLPSMLFQLVFRAPWNSLGDYIKSSSGWKWPETFSSCQPRSWVRPGGFCLPSATAALDKSMAVFFPERFLHAHLGNLLWVQGRAGSGRTWASHQLAARSAVFSQLLRLLAHFSFCRSKQFAWSDLAPAVGGSRRNTYQACLVRVCSISCSYLFWAVELPYSWLQFLQKKAHNLL